MKGESPVPDDVRAGAVGVILTGAPLSGGWKSTSIDQPIAWLLAGLAAAVVGRGGFFLVPRLVVGLLVGGALVSAWRNGRLGRIGLLGVGLAGLAMWGVVCGLIAGDLVGALAPAGTLAGFGVTVAVVAGTGRIQRDRIAAGAIIVGGLAALSGWAGVALRALPWAHVDGGLWRAATTLSYANAAAAVLAALTLLALGRLAGRPVSRPTVRRGAMERLAVTVLMVGLAATLSRAGIAGFALGWVVLAALVGLPPVLRATLRPVAGALIALVALAVSMPATSASRPAIAVVGLAAGLAVGALPWPRRWTRWPAVAAVAPVVIAAAVLAGSAHRPAIPGLWSDRTGLSSPDRNHETHAALALAGRHPVFGVGPGRTTLIWTTADHLLMVDRYAHDEYLQLAVEQGLPALLLLCLIAAALVQRMARGRPDRRRDRAGWSIWAGAAAGVVGVAAHSGFDFLWHVPAVLLVAALLVGLAGPMASDAQPVPTDNQEEI